MPSFVPVADEVWRLKRKHDAEGDFFRRFCELGHYRGGDDSNNTRQGIYAISPSGRFLTSTNSRDPAEVAEKLREALDLYKTLDAEDRLLENDPRTLNASVERLESKYPSDGLVLKQFTRDLPTPSAPTDWRSNAWNQDFVWLRKPEMLALATPGQIPKDLASWFARNHLIDNVRGQTEAYEPEDVITAHLTCDRVGTGILKLTGTFRIERSGHWTVNGEMAERTRGIEAAFLAHATFNSATQQFITFIAVALGTRWGATRFNARHDDPGPTPIGWSFHVAENTPENRIAPAHLWDAYGW
jgi:hypothetical protein